MISLLLAALAMTAQDTVAGPFDPLARYVEQSIARRAFPGAVVAVGRRDTVLYLRAFGRLDYEHRPAVTTQTVYDIASLTKVVGLTTAMMLLVEEGRVDLDAPATRYLPAFTAGGDSVTVRHLLTHSSGLAAWQPLFRQARSRAAMFALVDAAPLEHPPGTRMVYSDLGAILLTQIVETVTGERIDRFLARRLFRPLGMRATRFTPPASTRPRIAPTEHDTAWRGRLVRGEVHDENAAAMGGVSGHAGLFSTAGDLVKFAQFMLRGGTVTRRIDAPTHGRTEAGTGARARGGTAQGSPVLVRRETIEEFTRVQNPSLSSRAMGWDTPSEGSSAGARMTSRAYGHTGFTGTSLWIDPEQDLFVLLLSNRVHPTRDNDLIRAVRRQVADLAATAVISRPLDRP